MSPRDLIETSVGPVTVLHRLALGVLARDGITSRGAADGLRVGWEAAPPLLPPHHPGWWPCIDLEQVGGGRFRLRATASRPAIVVVRLHDPARRYVSRRLEVTLWPHAALVDPDPAHHVAVAARTLPVWLPPGAAYSLPRGATAVRGRVVRDDTPVQWARVVGVGPGNAVLGRARTDDRGEFLLILGETNQNPVQSTVGTCVCTVRSPGRPKAPSLTPWRTCLPNRSRDQPTHPSRATSITPACAASCSCRAPSATRLRPSTLSSPSARS